MVAWSGRDDYNVAMISKSHMMTFRYGRARNKRKKRQRIAVTAVTLAALDRPYTEDDILALAARLGVDRARVYQYVRELINDGRICPHCKRPY